MSWKFWKKKAKGPLKYFIVIDYTNTSKRMIVGGDRNKKIYHIFDDGSIPRDKFYLIPWNKLAFNTEPYDEIVIEEYRLKGIPIIDVTSGTSIPMDATRVPMIEQALDTIEWERRL